MKTELLPFANLKNEVPACCIFIILKCVALKTNMFDFSFQIIILQKV